MATLQTQVLGPDQTKAFREIVENIRLASEEVNKTIKAVKEMQEKMK
jgi:hypothetical protein